MRIKLTYTVLLTTLAIAFAIGLEACKKDVPPPANPYDSINYGDTLQQTDTVNPVSITGLHRNIFSKKCSQPACHDGSFEPDFRTVQSTYLSLVNHPLVKTDSTGFFVYRVKPFDTLHSWLHERLVTQDLVLGRMPLYANPLSTTEINQINTWIMNGAKNVDGSMPPLLPNQEPSTPGFLCLDMSNNVVDTNRLNDIAYNPFVLAPNTQYQLVFSISDDSTSMANMQNVKVMFNTQSNAFPTGATTYNATYIGVGQYQFWRIVFNTANFTSMQTYFRMYFNDGDHVNDTEYPRLDSGPQYKSYYSFIIQ